MVGKKTKHSLQRCRNLSLADTFKIVRLMEIHDGLKQTISTNVGFGLLQTVSDPNTKRCAREDVGTPKRVDYEITHWLKRGTKHFL